MEYITMGPVHYTTETKKPKRRSIFIRKIEYISNDVRALKTKEKQEFHQMLLVLKEYNEYELAELLAESISLKETYHMGMWNKFKEALTVHIGMVKEAGFLGNEALMKKTENQVKETLFFYLLSK